MSIKVSPWQVLDQTIPATYDDLATGENSVPNRGVHTFVIGEDLSLSNDDLIRWFTDAASSRQQVVKVIEPDLRPVLQADIDVDADIHLLSISRSHIKQGSRWAGYLRGRGAYYFDFFLNLWTHPTCVKRVRQVVAIVDHRSWKVTAALRLYSKSAFLLMPGSSAQTLSVECMKLVADGGPPDLSGIEVLRPIAGDAARDTHGSQFCRDCGKTIGWHEYINLMGEKSRYFGCLCSG